ncbi:uncharacterized protein LOC134828589 [Culicoides brevitarsis]|uniref:uncharacterized protein LOC134828589 n=1 Tax=Culicoides brevitarsis TaxID=469753 RepID=UPI00307C3286
MFYLSVHQVARRSTECAMEKLIVCLLLTILTVLAKSINKQETDSDSNKKSVPYTTRVENCLTESGVAPAMVNEYREGGFMSDDGNFKCYLQCMCHGIGHCDKNGAMLKSKIPRHIFNRIKDCVKVRGDNKCDTTYKQMLCMSEKA